MTFAYLPGYLQYPVMRQARQRGVQLEPPSTHLFLRGGLRSTFSHSKVPSAAWPLAARRRARGGIPPAARAGPGDLLAREPGGCPISRAPKGDPGGRTSWRCGEEVAALAGRRKPMSFAKSLSGQTHKRDEKEEAPFSLSLPAARNRHSRPASLPLAGISLGKLKQLFVNSESDADGPEMSYTGCEQKSNYWREKNGSEKLHNTRATSVMLRG